MKSWLAIQDGLMGACCRRRPQHFVVVLPISDAGQGRYRLVDAVYELRSLAPSSNLHPFELDQLMDKSIITALADRLLHHAHTVLTEGESVRLADATKGVVPQAV